jgi:hypothetical protein
VDNTGASARSAWPRWTDWRFLVPGAPTGSFDHVIALGGPADIGQIIVESGIAREVTREMSVATGVADAVVVFADGVVDLRAIGAALRAGGVLYWELDYRRASGPVVERRGLVRHLKTVGLTPAGMYWAAPNLERCQAFIPVEHRAALAWYATHIRGRPQAAGWLLRRLGNSLLGRLWPCQVVTALAQTDAAPPSVLAGPAVPIELRSAHMRPLVLVGGADQYGRVALLPFDVARSEPRVVAKVARIPERNVSVEHEQAALAIAQRQLDDGMQATIPRPIVSFKWGALAVGLETCARGRLLSSATRWRTRHQRLDDLRLVVDWLTSLQQQVHMEHLVWDEPARREWVTQGFTDFVRMFDARAREAELIARLGERARSLAGREIPIVWNHWGLTDRNIYRDGHHLTVVDWEAGGPGLPLLDLLYFVFHWYRAARRRQTLADEVDAFSRLFLRQPPADPLVAAARHATWVYMQRLEVAPDFYPVLLSLTWIQRAIGRAKRQQITGGSSDELRLQNRYVSFVSEMARYSSLPVSGGR